MVNMFIIKQMSHIYTNIVNPLKIVYELTILIINSQPCIHKLYTNMSFDKKQNINKQVFSFLSLGVFIFR